MIDAFPWGKIDVDRQELKVSQGKVQAQRHSFRKGPHHVYKPSKGLGQQGHGRHHCKGF